MRNADSEDFLDLCLVQDRIMRTFCTNRVLTRLARLYFAQITAEITYCPGKVIPRAYSFVGKVVCSCLVEGSGLDDVQDEFREITGICRGSYLVCY